MAKTALPDPVLDELKLDAAESNRQLRSFNNDYLFALAYVDLQPWDSDEYFENLKDRSHFIPRETPLRTVEKDEGISLWLRAKAFFGIGDARKELAVKARQAKEAYVEIRKREDERNQCLEEAFYERQEENHTYYDSLKRKAKNNYEAPSQEYFCDVLGRDEFRVNPYESYHVACSVDNYDRDTHTLSVRYRIPNPSEVLCIKEYVVDEEAKEIKPVPLSKKDAADRCRLVMKILLYRTVSLIYLSDTYRNIQNVSIVGCFVYDDEYEQVQKRRDVVCLTVSKADFANSQKTSLNIAALESFFEKLKKAKKYAAVTGLYSKSIDELRSLYE